MPTNDDGLLIGRLASGDHEALAAMYDRYAPLAFGLALRITRDRPSAEDAVQEAFLAVWRSAGSYVPGRATVRTWLLSIVHHRSIDLVRRRRAVVPLPEDEAVVSPALVTPDASGDVMASLDAAEVRAALATIPAAQRQAIELAYFGGLTQAEIAAATGAPLGTVKGRTRLGLHGLRRALGG